MKKLTLSIMAASMLLLFSPTQVKAGIENNATSTTVKSENANASEVGLTEMKAIDVSSLSTAENKEILKEVNTVKDQQGRHRGRGYGQNRRDVDVTVVARNDGPRYRESQGYHSHSTAYIGGGGVLILILILILIL